MLKSRPVQYLGLALLVLASLAVIYFPIGPRPQAQDYTLSFTAPRALSSLVKKGQTPADVADKALTAAFPVSEKLPTSALVIGKDGKTATIDDQATTRAEAQTRTDQIVGALTKAFPGLKLDTKSEAALAGLPVAPLLPIGQLAIFPPQHTESGALKPAVKLGLDLQGGVNLVLQVRRAVFPFTLDKPLPQDTTQRDAFTAQVRDALSRAGNNLGEANVVLSSDSDTALEIRTQASDQNEYQNQLRAVTAALKKVGDYTLTLGKAQFFKPDAGTQSGTATSDVDILNRTVEIIRTRVDGLGVSEPLIQAQGTDRIVVQLPGVNNPQKAVQVVGRTAQMNIYLLPQDITPSESTDASGQKETVFFETATRSPLSSEEVIRRSGTPIVSGRDMKPTSTVGIDQTNQPEVSFELTGEGAQHFGEATSRNVGRFMPIFLDQRCISAPVIRAAIYDQGQISGGFKTIEEARQLALLLNSGALPAPIDVVENRTVSATLGQDSLHKAAMAGLIGIIAVAIFMIAYYRLAGLLANCALVIYFVLNLAAFVLVGGTLTLPGIAGFLLAVAMSLDTNILVFERLREEMATQPTFSAALRAAFDRAWTAILDSHVTTLIAAVVLFNLGTGPVKGFALTLGIGVLLSLFSAISVTRLFMWSVAGVGQNNKSLFGKPVHRAAGVPSTGTPASTRS